MSAACSALWRASVLPRRFPTAPADGRGRPSRSTWRGGGARGPTFSSPATPRRGGAGPRILLCPTPRSPGGQPRPPFPDHRHLRHAHHFLHASAGAVRDGRRRVPAACQRLRSGHLRRGLYLHPPGHRGGAATTLEDGGMSAATWVLVGLLGGGAATARFLIDATIASRSDHPFPLGILAINLGGAFALGLVAGAALSGEALIVVAGGGIGSFTTFSTLMLDSHRLSEAGHTHLVWLNVGLSLIAGYAAIALGHWIGAH